MSTSQIGIIGGKSAGKTALLAAICNAYRSVGPLFSVSDPRYHPFMNIHRLEHSTAFCISGFKYTSDEAMITNLGQDLNSRPILWPAATTFGDHFPMMVDFESKRIFKSENTRNAEKAGLSFPDQSRLSHTIALSDMPGGHFDPEFIALGDNNAAEANRTKTLISTCEALIVCIDCSVLNFHSPDNEQKKANAYITGIINTIVDLINVIEKETRTNGHSDRIMPITLALTKFDLLIKRCAGDRQKADAHIAAIFDVIGLEAISSRNPNLWVMACPVQLVASNREIEVFRPENIELPFLYSTMAVLLSKAWHSHQVGLAAEKEQARVEAMPFWSWLFSSEVNSKIHGRIAERGRKASATEWEMARAIYESLCLQQHIEPTRIRSGRMGIEQKLCDMSISGKMGD